MPASCGSSEMPPRWALLEHNFPWLHWDLLLERSDGTAAHTWRLLRQPCNGEPIAAEPLPDHRLVYFDYEGEVSGGRGRVKRLERGLCRAAAEGIQGVASGKFALPCSVLLRLEFPGGHLFQWGELLQFPEQRFFWHFGS